MLSLRSEYPHGWCAVAQVQEMGRMDLGDPM